MSLKTWGTKISPQVGVVQDTYRMPLQSRVFILLSLLVSLFKVTFCDLESSSTSSSVNLNVKSSSNFFIISFCLLIKRSCFIPIYFSKFFILLIPGTDSYIRRLDTSFTTTRLTQRRIAELFDVDVRTISEHLGNIFSSSELERDLVIRKFRIVRSEDSRQVTCSIDLDRLKQPSQAA